MDPTSELRLERAADAAEFLATVGPWLTEREAANNLMLGIAGRVVAGAGESSDEPPFFASVWRGGVPVLGALRTPPHNLVISELDDPSALVLLADALAGESLPGVIGPPEVVDRFGELWTARHGGRALVRLEERAYQLTAVIPPRPVSGTPRRATLADRPQLEEWIVAFNTEALPHENPQRTRMMIADWDPETGREFWFWDDDGRPVSLVGAGSPTPNGIRIGPVYTPPADRGRGYASALTAFVTQRQLDAGRRACFLYTDLANPTSNHIYKAIGYEPVADARVVEFEGATPA